MKRKIIVQSRRKQTFSGAVVIYLNHWVCSFIHQEPFFFFFFASRQVISFEFWRNSPPVVHLNETGKPTKKKIQTRKSFPCPVVRFAYFVRCERPVWNMSSSLIFFVPHFFLIPMDIVKILLWISSKSCVAFSTESKRYAQCQNHFLVETSFLIFTFVVVVASALFWCIFEIQIKKDERFFACNFVQFWHYSNGKLQPE